MENMDKQLPMNWYKFIIYFRFPLGIIGFVGSMCSLYFFDNSDIPDNLYLFSFCLDIAILFFMIITYINLIAKNKFGYISNIAYLALECIMVPLSIDTKNENPLPLNIYLICFCIFTVIWFLPNYIYYKKRKHLFYKTIGKSNIEKSEAINYYTEKRLINSTEQYDDISKEEPITNISYKVAIPYVLLVIAIVLGFVINFTSVSEVNYLKGAISDKDKEIKVIENRLSDAHHYAGKYKENSDFLIGYIVIVPSNTNIYHRYDCKYLDHNSTFTAYNTNTAKVNKYKPCSTCIK